MKTYDILNLKKKTEGIFKSGFLKKNLNLKILYEQLIPIIIIFLLSRTIVFSNMAPFGAAFYLGVVKSKKDLPTLMASILGYVTILGQTNIYKYIAVMILTYGVCWIFESKLEEIKNQYKMQIVGGGLFFVVSMGFNAISPGITLYSLILTFSEVLMVACAGYFFNRAAFKIKNLSYEQTIENEDLISCIILCSLLFLSLSNVFIGDLSIGRILGIFIILCLAQSKNMSVAAIMGMIFGLALGIYDKYLVGLCVIYGFSAIACGIFSNVSRIVGVSSFIILLSVMVVYFDGSALGVMWILESVIAGILSLLVSKGFLKSIKLSFREPEEKSDTHEEKLRQLIEQRLRGLSKGYREVFEAVITVSDKLLKTNYNNISTVYDKVCKNVCRGCGLLNICWQRDYDATVDNLNKVSNTLVKNGKIKKNEMPVLFINRCIRPERFIEGINDAYTDLRMRKKLYQKQQQTKQLSCQQYISLAKVMEQTANELTKKICFDINAEERIIKYLNKIDISPAFVMVMIDDARKLSVEIDLDISEYYDLNISKEEFLKKISEIIGVSVTEFNIVRKKDLIRIILSQKETFSPSYAFVTNKKDGASVSGDNVGIFKTEKSKLVMQIGDGMGSGRRAAFDSAIAAGVIEKILKAGFDNDAAVNILNSAMLLKSDDENVISVDLAILDLYSGDCEFLKMGAAPSYIMRSGLVSRIDSVSLPLGIFDHVEAKCTSVNLGSRDIILMVSDGVISSGDDFIFDILQDIKDADTKELCNILLSAAKQKNGGVLNDDMSILCARL